MNCKVCGEEIHFDGWTHALKGSGPDGTGFMIPKDEDHAKVLSIFKDKNWEGPCPICGGHVTHAGYGEDSWEISCDDCQFLFDED